MDDETLNTWFYDITRRIDNLEDGVEGIESWIKALTHNQRVIYEELMRFTQGLTKHYSDTLKEIDQKYNVKQKSKYD